MQRFEEGTFCLFKKRATIPGWKVCLHGIIIPIIFKDMTRGTFSQLIKKIRLLTDLVDKSV
jgi:hypothetical protein